MISLLFPADKTRELCFCWAGWPLQQCCFFHEIRVLLKKCLNISLILRLLNLFTVLQIHLHISITMKVVALPAYHVFNLTWILFSTRKIINIICWGHKQAIAHVNFKEPSPRDQKKNRKIIVKFQENKLEKYCRMAWPKTKGKKLDFISHPGKLRQKINYAITNWSGICIPRFKVKIYERFLSSELIIIKKKHAILMRKALNLLEEYLLYLLEEHK